MRTRAVVVDDDPESASVVAALLQRLGCEVTVCASPQRAVEPALSGDADLVSLDISMPELDGYQVLSLIRSHEHSRRLPSVPVIAVTGRVAPADQAEALAGGFAAHLAKPVMLEGLRDALARALLLRNELHRTRYSVDFESIQERFREVTGQSREDQVKMAAGMALALEQRGRTMLKRALQTALEGDAGDARVPVAELARMAHAFGAARLASSLNDLADQFMLPGEPLKTAAVLARAELDRVIFTLREQVLH